MDDQTTTRLAELLAAFPHRLCEVADAYRRMPWHDLGFASLAQRDALVRELWRHGHSNLIDSSEWI